MPSFWACRSRPATTQVGKSTFTRLASTLRRRAFVQSTWADMSSPASNRSSNSVAFIVFNLLLASAAHGDDPHRLTPVCVDSRPVSGTDHANRQKAWLICDVGGGLDQIRIIPESLGLIKIDPVLFTVRGALVGVILELHDWQYMPEMV